MAIRVQDKSTKPIYLYGDVRQGEDISPNLYSAALDVLKLLERTEYGTNINGVYGIAPESLGTILTSDHRVQAHVIFIGSLGDEANTLLRRLPAGHAHVCMDVAALPHILQQIFASSLLQSDNN